MKAESNDRASGEAGDKCQENIATATTAESSASTLSWVCPDVYLCNISGANAQELAHADNSLVPSAGPSFHDDNDNDLLRPSPLEQQRVDDLSMIFPRIPREIVRNVVITCASMNTAVNVFFQYGEVDHNINPSNCSGDQSNSKIEDNPPQTVRSLPFVLQKLRMKMKSRGMHEKLKIDPEDEVVDAYSTNYKCTDFDPLVPMCLDEGTTSN